MNTDACNVEDINISKSQSVCRCLSLHLLKIGSVSFALDHSLCKNDLDSNDISDSAPV